MEVTPEIANEFISILIKRGLGLYGDDKMTKICADSGIICKKDGSFIKIHEDIKIIIEQLIINYAKFNLPAKMTALVLAKKYNIPIPNELKTALKRKSKYRLRFEDKANT